MAQAAEDLVEQGAPASEATIPSLSQLLSGMTISMLCPAVTLCQHAHLANVPQAQSNAAFAFGMAPEDT